MLQITLWIKYFIPGIIRIRAVPTYFWAEQCKNILLFCCPDRLEAGPSLTIIK